MKNPKYIPLIILCLALTNACKLKSEFCEERHPHNDKLIIDVKWNDDIKANSIPDTLMLYYWENNADKPIIKETTPNNGKYTFNLPKPGNYQMMLVGKLTDQYFHLNLQSSYNQFNTLIALTPKLTNNLLVKNLGNINIKDNTTLFLNTEVNQYSRNMSLNVILEDMYEQPIAANVTFTGFANSVNMNNQQYSGNYNIILPLNINQNKLSTAITYFKANNTSNDFQISITNPQNITITKTVNFTKELLEFEQTNPFSQNLDIETGIMFTRINGVFDFVIKYITINGTTVYRSANA